MQHFSHGGDARVVGSLGSTELTEFIDTLSEGIGHEHLAEGEVGDAVVVLWL